MRLVQRHALGVMTGTLGQWSWWLSQTPRLSSVQHQTARGEMTDDGENAELRTAEAGGGAGRGRGGGRWPPRISRSPAPVCAAVCRWSWSRRGRCSELESRYKIRSRGRGGSQPSAAACVCFKPCPRHTTVSCYCIWSTGPVFVKLWCSPEYLLRLAVWLIKILKTAHPINEGLCGQASKLLEPSMRLPSLNIVNILLELVVRCSCLLSV